MSDLAELLERVKAATGPDREIDRELMALTYVWETRCIGATCWPECCPAGWHQDEVWVDPQTNKWVTTGVDGFELTRSLDAALALVERVLPGWQIALAGPWVYAAHTPNAGRPIWCAEIARDTEDDGLGYKEVNDLPWSAATPALALVAALLHALIDQGQTAVGDSKLTRDA